MADISIPGVTDKYGTNNLVEQLMKVERVPLTREQTKLETYKSEQDAWRSVNLKMSTLRESVRNLYSFDNPFSSKISSSTEENAITADADRNANVGSFKIKVEQIATADRFLSKEISSSEEVPAGKYTYKVNDKEVSFNWKGGKVSDFVSSLNRRGNGIVKASLIGVSSESKSLLIESLLTGKENKLVFEDEAFNFAVNSQMISEKSSSETTLVQSKDDIESISGLAISSVKIDDTKITVPPKSGFQIELPRSVKTNENHKITFTVTLQNTESEVTKVEKQISPIMPDAQTIQFKDAIVFNMDPELGYTPEKTVEEIKPIEDFSVVYLTADDSEIALQKVDSTTNSATYTINVGDYNNLEYISIKNNNTAKIATVSLPNAVDETVAKGYEPTNAISEAQDAKIKYEGITMFRSTNKIDDIVENITLNLEAPTEKTATIKIEPDTETAKEKVIELVGYYNQLIAEINILTQNKPELIAELTYLSDDEQDAYNEKLGLFSGDSTLTSSKSAIQRIITNTYPIEGTSVKTLGDIGISSNATGNSSYDASKMRGYLEIDEKKLDEKLKESIGDIKNLFGFDSDGDLIIDTGIAYLLEKNLQSYVQTGGILANKTRTLDSKIKSTEQSISKLETQLADKEASYKHKFASMESSLSNLESQSTAIDNFNKQNNNNNNW